MTGIRSFVVATAVAIVTVGVSTSTRAGESPAGALAFSPPNWTGCYIGGALGARRTDSDLSISAIDEAWFTGAPGVQHDFPACTLNPQPCGTGASFDSTAFRLAMYGGYNWQIGERWVAGIEGDLGWANNKSTESGFSYYQGNGSPDSSYTLKSNWDASARARIGFLATPSLLVL
jgi:outer membrane immunogenic protein